MFLDSYGRGLRDTRYEGRYLCRPSQSRSKDREYYTPLTCLAVLGDSCWLREAKRLLQFGNTSPRADMAKPGQPRLHLRHYKDRIMTGLRSFPQCGSCLEPPPVAQRIGWLGLPEAVHAKDTFYLGMHRNHGGRSMLPLIFVPRVAPGVTAVQWFQSLLGRSGAACVVSMRSS